MLSSETGKAYPGMGIPPRKRYSRLVRLEAFPEESPGSSVAFVSSTSSAEITIKARNRQGRKRPWETNDEGISEGATPAKKSSIGSSDNCGSISKSKPGDSEEFWASDRVDQHVVQTGIYEWESSTGALQDANITALGEQGSDKDSDHTQPSVMTERSKNPSGGSIESGSRKGQTCPLCRNHGETRLKAGHMPECENYFCLGEECERVRANNERNAKKIQKKRMDHLGLDVNLPLNEERVPRDEDEIEKMLFYVRDLMRENRIPWNRDSTYEAILVVLFGRKECNKIEMEFRLRTGLGRFLDALVEKGAELETDYLCYGDLGCLHQDPGHVCNMNQEYFYPPNHHETPLAF
ncbi:unnamed protein product [Darwinula stevensoni]|uniref:Uncharacterized protein n=1 Tax=Darwinula stevensoni TaxID=69355 RepID=A0A7R9AG06_9CRUS|nr:unnamed protein product [Darwinula stevensoni]CAG0902926.1 unnamed protein product [Darwinula stevensoni]